MLRGGEYEVYTVNGREHREVRDSLFYRNLPFQDDNTSLYCYVLIPEGKEEQLNVELDSFKKKPFCSTRYHH